MQLIQHIFHTFLSIAEKVLDACENGVDYSQFQRELQEKFNKLGCEICREVLEAHDQYLLRNRSQRKGWHVERRNDSKRCCLLLVLYAINAHTSRDLTATPI